MKNPPLNILLLEDNDHDMTMIREELDNLNIPFTLTHVKSREDYFSELDRLKPDIVLCDYNLPSYDGFAAFKYLKSKGIAIPFILITGTLTDEMAAEITLAGIDDYLLKDRLSRLPMAIKKNLELRKKADSFQASAQLLEKKYKVVADNVSDIVAAHTLEGEYTYASPAALAILGYTADELKGSSVFDYVHPDDSSLMRLVYDNFPDEKKTVSVTLRMRKKDCTYVTMECLLYPFYDAASGKIVEIVTVSKDMKDMATA